MLNSPKQTGAVLAIGLLLLVGITVIAVATMSSTHMQERMAGNARTQAIAFEAASAAASDAIKFFVDQRDAGALAAYGTCMESGHSGWLNPDGEYLRTAWVPNTALESSFDAEVRIYQRLYCLSGPVRSQLFVLARGEVVSGPDDTPVARRDIEVRLDRGMVPAEDFVGGDGCGAFCFPGCNPGTLTFPTSDPFTVDGDDQPAITAGCDLWGEELVPEPPAKGNAPPTSGIWASKIGSYVGGDVGPPSIASSYDTLGSPWDTKNSVLDFRDAVASAAQAAPADGCPNCYFPPPGHTDNGNTTYGTSVLGQITYIDGNASMGGNISGEGIMFVNGNLNWAGTPQFKGLIVVLGGTFSVSGGGEGGIPQGGSIVVLNTESTTDLDENGFGKTNLSFTGGGTAGYTFDCDALWAAHDLLDGDAAALWQPNCERDAGSPPSPFLAGPTELTIVSWRENIGWRDRADLFAPEGE